MARIDYEFGVMQWLLLGACGFGMGIVPLKYLPQKWFNLLALLLAAAAAVKLLF